MSLGTLRSLALWITVIVIVVLTSKEAPLNTKDRIVPAAVALAAQR